MDTTLILIMCIFIGSITFIGTIGILIIFKFRKNQLYVPNRKYSKMESTFKKNV
ncbi:hypothetical protein CLCOS_17770 [Clostridium coskatii]|uniref:Uncharacterized protein n=1 Tax=Clostridium coskatii TaxID=1705578 RepID=A0A168NFG8_9CLOT|nr:hypothetical protein WX73_02837 [Clostridium coskatii]OAA86361.1 hypothetical protein WX73_02855 [Clostridium coskatii]OBR95072.1 hypothetical protein CLCOS_17770 [Clostridium coskatii]